MQLLALTLFIALSALPQATGSIAGSVLKTGTTNPIERAEVTLTREGMEIRSTFTDSKGSFFFAGLVPGQFTIRIQRDGYFGNDRSRQSLFDTASFSSGIVMGDRVVTNPATATINVVGSQHRADLVYFLTPGGIVTGRVLGPFAGAIVSASRLDFYHGNPRLTQVKSAISDDRGDFRISWLEAGDYFIRANATYFPGTDNAGKALKIHVAEGSESSAINIPIGTSENVTVSGLAINSATTNRTSSRFMLIPTDPDITLDRTMDVENSVRDQEELRAGKFELRDVRPGTYDLVAIRTEREANAPVVPVGPTYVGRTSVVVGTEDVKGVAIAIARGRDIHGHVTYAGGLAPSAGITLRVQLWAKGLFSVAVAAVNYSAPVSPEGTFTIPNVPELPFSVSVTGLPRDGYIADLRQGGRSVFDTGTITLDARPEQEFEIVLSSPGATINGSISASPQELSSGGVAILIPADRAANTTLLRRVNLTNAGGFLFSGVVPGSYRLLAFESLPSDAELNRSFMEAFRGDGREIIVRSGETATVVVSIIPRLKLDRN